jgi:hypothetical protein
VECQVEFIGGEGEAQRVGRERDDDVDGWGRTGKPRGVGGRRRVWEGVGGGTTARRPSGTGTGSLAPRAASMCMPCDAFRFGG